MFLGVSWGIKMESHETWRQPAYTAKTSRYYHVNIIITRRFPYEKWKSEENLEPPSTSYTLRTSRRSSRKSPYLCKQGSSFGDCRYSIMYSWCRLSDWWPFRIVNMWFSQCPWYRLFWDTNSYLLCYGGIGKQKKTSHSTPHLTTDHLKPQRKIDPRPAAIIM